MTATHPSARHRALRALGLLVALATGLLGAGTADVMAQATYYAPPPPANGPRYLNPIQLEQLVAPIALYPDDLIGIVLPASTLPQQVVEAAAYLDQLRGNPGLPPNEAWDDSIVALLNYPDVVNMLSHDVAWTESLGAAVIYQQADVLTAVRDFRYRAWAAGNLRSDERQVVERGADGVIVIRPANPQVIYVPYYEPARVLVTQTYPVYRYYPRPCPVYYYRYDRGRPSGFANFWAVGTFFSIGWNTGRVHLRDYDYFDDPFYARPSVGFYYRRSWDHRRHDHDRSRDRDHDHDRRRDDRHDGNRDGRGRRDGSDEVWHPPARLGQAVAPGNAPPQRGPRDGGGDRGDRGDRGERGDRGDRGDRGNRGDRPDNAPPATGSVVPPTDPRRPPVVGETPNTRPPGRDRGDDDNGRRATPEARANDRRFDQDGQTPRRPLFSTTPAPAAAPVPAPAPAAAPGSVVPSTSTPAQAAPDGDDRSRPDRRQNGPPAAGFGSMNGQPPRAPDGVRGRGQDRDGRLAPPAGAPVAPVAPPPSAVSIPNTPAASPPVQAPRGLDTPRRMDLPRAMDNPRRIDAPTSPPPQPTVQPTPRVDMPRTFDGRRSTEMPQSIPSPRPLDTPRAAEQPRQLEMPRPVQPPPRMEQPRPLEMPRPVQPPPRMEQPRPLEMPRPVQPPPRMEQPRPLEMPRPVQPPPRMEQPRAIEPPRRESPRPMMTPSAAPPAAPAAQAGPGDGGRRGERGRHQRDND